MTAAGPPSVSGLSLDPSPSTLNPLLYPNAINQTRPPLGNRDGFAGGLATTTSNNSNNNNPQTNPKSNSSFTSLGQSHHAMQQQQQHQMQGKNVASTMDGDYQTARYRLDQLEYREWLDPSSTALVSRLLADLVATTQTAREWKGMGSGMQEEIRTLTDQLNPLRRELSGLEQENGALHRQIIDLQDTRDRQLKAQEKAARASEATVSELRFMNEQLRGEVSRERDRSRAALQKVEALGEKIGILNPHSMGGAGNIKQQEKIKRDKLFERIQKIDIETGLSPLETTEASGSLGRPYFPPPNPVFVDLVAIAEEAGEKEKKERKDYASKCSAYQEEITMLLEQMGKRDREITRLSSHLELVRNNQFTTGLTKSGSASGGRSSSLALNHDIQDLDAARDRIAHLDLQVESLHTHIEGVEREIEEMEGQKVTMLTSVADEKKVVELELEKERKRTALLVSNLSRMEEMVAELEGLKRNPPTTSTGGQIKPSTAVKNAKLVQELTAKVSTAAVKYEQAQKRLQMLQRDVGRLTNENGKLKEQIGAQDVNAGSSGLKPVATPAPTDNSANTTSAGIIDEIKDLEGRLLDCLRSRDSLQTKVNILQQEKDASSSSISTLTAKLETTDRNLQDLKIERFSLAKKLQEGEQERESLIGALVEFEGVVSDVHKRVEVVTKERDTMKGLYNQVHAELEKSRREKGALPHAAPTSIPVPATAGPVKENDTAKFNELQKENLGLRTSCQNLEVEIASLKLDMKAMITRQRENGSLASEAVDLLDKELNEVKEMLLYAQSEKESLQQELDMCVTDRDEIRKNNNNINRQADGDAKKINQYTIDNEKLRLELRQAISLKSEVENRLDTLKRESKSLQAKLVDKDRMIGEQRNLLDEIDRERDGYQRQLDTKSEQLLELQDSTVSLQQRFEASESNKASLQQQVETLTAHLNNSDREYAATARQLQDANSAVKHWEDQAQQYHNEGQRLASDLVALTRENQILNGELGETSSARERFRAELVECESQLVNLNELIRSKDEEKQEILMNYRKVIADYERLDVASRSNLDEMNNLRMELVSRDKKLVSLERQLDQVSREATQFQIDNNAHAKQHSQLSKSLATSERLIKQLNEDKIRLTREANSSREMAFSVDRGKDSLQQNFVALKLDYDRLRHEVDKNLVEVQALKTQLRTETLKSERLEELLSAERTKQFEIERSGEDMKYMQSESEAKLKALCEQQENTLAATKGQLEDARAAILASGSRISNLEELVSMKENDSNQAHLLLNRNQAFTGKLQTRVSEHEKTIQELTKLYLHANPLPADALFKSELLQVQREKDRMDEQLASQEHQMEFEQQQQRSPTSPQNNTNNTSGVGSLTEDSSRANSRLVQEAILATVVQKVNNINEGKEEDQSSGSPQ